MPILPILGELGSVLGGAARGSAGQRNTETDYALRNQGLLQQGARDAFTAGLHGANFSREGQDRQRRAQILMSLLGNTQDANIAPGNPAIAARMPTMTGGPRPSNLTSNPDALMRLLQAPEIETPQYQGPSPLNLQGAGMGENILGGAGLGSSILSLLGPLLASLRGRGQPSGGNPTMDPTQRPT